MLRLIDAATKGQANKIHRAAIRYYRAGGEPGLNADVAAGEAYYHTLMVTTRARAAKLNPAEVRRYESMLVPSLDDLPAHVLAVVKAILRRALTDTEGLALPEPQRTDFILRQGERCVRNDEPYRALELLKSSNLHPYWELQALASTVGWHEARERGLLATPTEALSGIADTGDLYDRANLATWVSFCLGDSSAAYAIAAKMLTVLDPRIDWTTIDARLLEQVARRVSYRAIAARDEGRPEMPEHRIPWERLSAEHLGFTTMAMEATRHAVLGLGDQASEDRVVFSGESLPPSRKLLKQLSASGLPPEMKRKVDLVLRHLQKAGRGASSGEILGDIARKFPKAVIVDARRWTGLRDQWRLVCPSSEFRGPGKVRVARHVQDGTGARDDGRVCVDGTRLASARSGAEDVRHNGHAAQQPRHRDREAGAVSRSIGGIGRVPAAPAGREAQGRQVGHGRRRVRSVAPRLYADRGHSAPGSEYRPAEEVVFRLGSSGFVVVLPRYRNRSRTSVVTFESGLMLEIDA